MPQIRSRSSALDLAFVGAAAAALLLMGGCSDDQTTGDSSAVVPTTAPDQDTYVPPNTVHPGDVLPGHTPVDKLTVETGVSDDGPMAGEAIEVFCTVEGLASGQEAPATRWEVYETPDGMSQAPEAAGNMLTLFTEGDYKVRCVIAQTAWADPTPTRVTVSAGAARDILTELDPAEIRAGDKSTVTCSGTDAYGNEVLAEDFEIVATPGGDQPGIEDGVVEANGRLKGLTVGTYVVACRQLSGPTDDDPPILTVTPGLPFKLVTTLESPSIRAGTSTKVDCHAEDKLGNTVPDLPMTIAIPGTLQIVGFQVGGTLTGKFSVKCVPQALDWTAFHLDDAILEVLAGDPVSLELALQPPKPFFATLEQLTILVLAHDQYGNLVPDAEVGPLEVSPDQDWIANGPLKLRFKEEGFYTIATRLAADPSVEASLEVVIEGAPPQVTVLFPPRGATVQGTKPSVTVSGIANDAITGIAQVLVNGKNAKLNEDGTFTKIIIPKWGLNVLTIEATDEGGQTETITQSFYFAEKYYPTEPDMPYIPDAIKTWISQQFIDDGNHNPAHPDDLATIIEVAAAGLDFSSLLGGGAMEIGAGYELQIKQVTFNPPKFQLDTVNGGIRMDGSIKNLYVKVKLVGECKVLGIDFCPDFSGSASIDNTSLDAIILASATDGVLAISLANPQVNLDHLDINIDGILGWLFDWLIDFFVGIFTDTIEDAIEDQMGAIVEDALADVIGALAISQTLELGELLPGMDPLTLTLESNIWSLGFTPEGGRLGLGARILATKKVPHEILGVIARGTCLKGWPTLWQLPGGSEFEAALWDDFMNEVLTALWYSGLLEIDLDAATLGELMGGDGGGLDLGGLPVDEMAVKLSFLLPPIVNGCTEDGLIRLQIGDMFLHAEFVSDFFEGGNPKMGAYIAMELGMEVVLGENLDGDTVISAIIQPLDLDNDLTMHWEYVPVEFEDDVDVLEDLLKDQLFGALGADLFGVPIGEFAVPEIDLGSLVPDLGDGVILAPALESLSHQNGHLLIQGYLE